MWIMLEENVPLIVAALVGVGTLFLLMLIKFRRATGAGVRLVVPKDTVLLYGVGRGMYTASASPFPLKLETFLRMAKIPYMVDNSHRMSKKGKTPWMEYNGQVVEDSQFCIEYLKEKRDLDLDADLSPSTRATARAFREMVEENLYWTLCHELFIKHAERLGEAIPMTGLKLRLLTARLQKIIRNEMHGHGIGRHTDAEIWDIARRDLDALSHYLDDKKYFCGDEPHEVDCAIFGMLAQFPYHMPWSQHTLYMQKNLPNLLDYVERMKTRVFPDWEQRCKGGNHYEEDNHVLYSPKNCSP